MRMLRVDVMLAAGGVPQPELACDLCSGERSLMRISLAWLVLVDLPVDVVVVLEQQERAGQGERIAHSARERGWSAPWEHVFVR
jgi:hypothetical protein